VDMSPYFLKWRGRPVLPPPLLSGVDIFVMHNYSAKTVTRSLE